MDINIYSVTAEDADLFVDMMPEYIGVRLSSPGYFALGAVSEDDELLGITVFYIGVMTDKSYYAKIVYMYVEEEFRGQGVGGAFLSKMHDIFSKTGIEESFVLIESDNEEVSGVRAFFKHMGYSFGDENTYIYDGELSEMVDSSFANKQNLIETTDISVFSPKEFERTLRRIIDKDTDVSGDLALSVELERDFSVYDHKLSSYYKNEDGEGVFLIRKLLDDFVEPVYLRGYGKEVDDNLYELILRSAKTALNELPADTEVYIDDISKSNKELVDDFNPNLKPITMEKGIRATT